MTKPQISVVMGVYNEESTIEATLESILSQREVELEFIIVNDGSTDQTEAIIRKRMKNDECIILINQSNVGLTRSLIVGCERASADYIARQDAGDISLPGRLIAQLEAFKTKPSLAMVSTGTDFTAPEGEIFDQIVLSKQDAAHGLKQNSVHAIKGPPHHGSVMFKKDLYNKVGGYRKEFIVAQDLDLWTRLVEQGEHFSLQTIYYQASANKGSISSLQRDAQLEAAKIVLQCVAERKINGNDQAILKKMNLLANTKKGTTQANPYSDADFYYFIASNLKDNKHPASNKYFKKALNANPFHWKARLKSLF